MSGISAAGIGSGLDLEALIEVSIEARRVPQQARLDERKDTLDVTLSAVGAVKSAMSAFRKQLDVLRDADKLFPRMALVDGQIASRVDSAIPDEDEDEDDDDNQDSSSSSSNGYNGPYDVSMNNRAANGTYDVDVQQIAQGSRLSSSMVFASDSSVVSDVDTQLTFSAGSGDNEETFTVEVTAGMTLRQLREEINNSAGNFGVSANIINSGGGSQLVIDSDKTGVDELGNANNLTISNTGAGDTTLDGLLGSMTLTKEASNAIIEVNGIQATSDTNLFREVISGIDITVNRVTDSATELEVKADDSTAVENIKAFVDAYNRVITELDKYSRAEEVARDEENTDRKVLSGDAMFRSMKNSLSRMATVGYSHPTEPDRVITFYALGIRWPTDEKDNPTDINDQSLEVNTRELRKWLEEDPEALKHVFSGEGGVVDTFYGFVESFEQTGGILEQRSDSVKQEQRRVDKAQIALDDRMADYERTLRAKYTAFDVTMGQMNSQMSWIYANLG
ncbi:flagellar filament capping protein FliD [Aliagarivorans taiwanensis]|uniref:flagellar filament capping protein FliD n=1 Tax=Aliagarivorans taiwanensis TaxID=561966 RepID=UPI00041AEF52|nr:flagellar filament capping protein FliD [Aliagarivorans taiwanensis]